jgi:ATP-dependent Lon protease
MFSTENDAEMGQSIKSFFTVVTFSPLCVAHKMLIATGSLLPKLETEFSFPAGHVSISNEAMSKIIKEYTFEGGVEGLLKLLDMIFKNVVR